VLFPGSETTDVIYRIRPLVTDRCVIAGNHACYAGDLRERLETTSGWWKENPGPVLGDAGLENVSEMNRGGFFQCVLPVEHAGGRGSSSSATPPTMRSYTSLRNSGDRLAK